MLRHLLDRGETVRVLSQNSDRLPPSLRERCEVIAGSLDDTGTLERGFAGAEAAFWCIPQSRPGNMWSDERQYHLRFATAAARALERPTR